MTDDHTQPTSAMNAALLRGMTQRRLSRRNLMKYAGLTVGALTFADILAACASDTTTSGAGTGTGSGMEIYDPANATKTINFANWPIYIDKARENGQTIYPSLEQFKDETGITVNYNDEINSNEDFFGVLLPQLQAGQDTGRDIIVITNGAQLSALMQNGWVRELDPTRRPNFDANAASWAKDPAYDPGNAYTMAWQSGLTGIGWNTDLVEAPLSSLDDLMNESKVPPGSVGVIKGDAPDLVMINLGIDPKTSGQAEWDEAAAWLTKLRDAPTFRTAYDQGYIDDFTNKNLAATMSWSGDVLYYKIWENYPFEWVVPNNGALLWIDNMMIPANSANPAGALMLMDYYYRPEVAQLVTEWVLYMSPVPAVQGLIEQHSKDVKDPSYAKQLASTAENPLLWPDQALLERTSFGRNITTDEELDAWNRTFNSIWEG
jgi:spermidine/putrescine transport system substrate-binding protein